MYCILIIMFYTALTVTVKYLCLSQMMKINSVTTLLKYNRNPSHVLVDVLFFSYLDFVNNCIVVLTSFVNQCTEVACTTPVKLLSSSTRKRCACVS